MARDHWSSDMFIGTALGLAIAENTFHARCNPEFESQCKGTSLVVEADESESAIADKRGQHCFIIPKWGSPT